MLPRSFAPPFRTQAFQLQPPQSRHLNPLLKLVYSKVNLSFNKLASITQFSCIKFDSSVEDGKLSFISESGLVSIHSNSGRVEPIQFVEVYSNFELFISRNSGAARHPNYDFLFCGATVKVTFGSNWLNAFHVQIER